MRALIGLAPALGGLAIALLALPTAGLGWGGGGPPLIGPLCSAVAARTGGFTFDLWITGPLIGSGLLYGGGLLALWSRVGIGHGVRPWQALAFAAAWLCLAVALVSPLHRAGEQLFTAHMVEHELVMAVAAPLLVLARPGAAFLWALPRPVRRRVGAVVRGGPVRSLWRGVTQPLAATLLHGVAIWAWHVPALFDAAVVTVALHRLQHISFLVTAVVFWWAMVRRSPHGAACGHLFVTMTHTGLLGAWMALAPQVLYRAQTSGAPGWGLSPLEDQQFAGLVMWVPAGTVYAGAAVAFMALWIRRSGLPAQWEQAYALRQG